MYQGQKAHLFRSSFLAEEQPRLENRRRRAELHITFFRRPHELQNKDIIGKITNLFCIYFFQLDKFINTY
jgi:hypothetical protein